MSAPEIVEYPSFAVAKAACGEGEVVVAEQVLAGGVWGWRYGVGPAVVEIETPRGVRRQPFGEFATWWAGAVIDEAQRRAV